MIYFEPWKRYATFTGRACRREFWTFSLVNGAIGMLLILPTLAHMLPALLHHQIPAPQPGDAVLGWIYDAFSLAQLIPYSAVYVRRLHDTDRSGWWALLNLLPIVGALVVFVWLCSIGTDGDNRYGSDPLQDDIQTAAPTL